MGFALLSATLRAPDLREQLAERLSIEAVEEVLVGMHRGRQVGAAGLEAGGAVGVDIDLQPDLVGDVAMRADQRIEVLGEIDAGQPGRI